MKIRSKLSLSFLATVAIMSVAVSAMVSRDAVTMAKESFAFDVAIQAKMIDSMFDSFINMVKADVRYLASDDRNQHIPSGLSSYMGIEPRLADSTLVGGYEADIERYYSRYAENREYLTNIYLGTADGGFVNLINNTLSNYDPRKRPWYELAT